MYLCACQSSFNSIAQYSTYKDAHSSYISTITIHTIHTHTCTIGLTRLVLLFCYFISPTTITGPRLPAVAVHPVGVAVHGCSWRYPWLYPWLSCPIVAENPRILPSLTPLTIFTGPFTSRDPALPLVDLLPSPVICSKHDHPVLTIRRNRQASCSGLCHPCSKCACTVHYPASGWPSRQPFVPRRDSSWLDWCHRWLPLQVHKLSERPGQAVLFRDFRDSSFLSRPRVARLFCRVYSLDTVSILFIPSV